MSERILNMAMSHKKRMRTINEATPEQYFQMLTDEEQKQMSRAEKSALRGRGSVLRAAATRGDGIEEWNAAAEASGNKRDVLRITLVYENID